MGFWNENNTENKPWWYRVCAVCKALVLPPSGEFGKGYFTECQLCGHEVTYYHAGDEPAVCNHCAQRYYVCSCERPQATITFEPPTAEEIREGKKKLKMGEWKVWL